MTDYPNNIINKETGKKERPIFLVVIAIILPVR